jgi:Phage integrase, N-terminal SAM-like domain
VHPSLNAKVTVAEWLEEWRASHSLHKRPTTLARDVSAIRRHLVPQLGDIQLAKPRRTDVQGFVADLHREVGIGTSRSIYGVLRAALNAALNAELRARSPARGIKLAPNTQDRRGHLPPQELHTLAAALPDRWGPVVSVAGACGLRFPRSRPTRRTSRSRAPPTAGDRNRAPSGRRPRRTQDRRRAPHRPAAWSDRPGARRASPPAPPHRRSRSPTRPLPQSRTGRRHLWCRTHHPGIRQDPHRRVPVRGQQASAGCDHRLRRPLPALIRVGGAPLQPGPRPGSPPPSRRADRRPRLAPHHLGVLAHQHRLRTHTAPRRTTRHPPDSTKRTQALPRPRAPQRHPSHRDHQRSTITDRRLTPRGASALGGVAHGRPARGRGCVSTVPLLELPRCSHNLSRALVPHKRPESHWGSCSSVFAHGGPEAVVLVTEEQPAEDAGHSSTDGRPAQRG